MLLIILGQSGKTINSASNAFTFTIADILMLLSIALTFLSVKIGHKRQGVTDNRLSWVQKIRELSAEIIGFSGEKASDEELREYLKSTNQLKLMLNIKDSFDMTIRHFLNSLSYYNTRLFNNSFESKTQKENSIAQLNENEKCFALCIQIYLKVEWERVKKENKIFRCPVKIIKKENKKVSIKYNKFEFDDEVYKILSIFIANDPIIMKINEIYERYQKMNEKEFLEPTVYTNYVVAFPKSYEQMRDQDESNFVDRTK